MGRTIQELAGVRDGVRRQWLLPVPGAFPGAPEIEDTSEETLALLAKQRQFSAGLLRAIRAGNPDAINEAIRPAGRPTGSGRFATLLGGNIVAGGDTHVSFGPIGYPYIIREIVLTGGSQEAATGISTLDLTLHLTTGDLTGLTTTITEAVIWPEEEAAGARQDALTLHGQDSGSVRYTAAKLVTDVGFFLTAQLNSFPTSQITASIGILIEEVIFGAGGLGALYLPPLGRVSLDSRTRPPPARLPGRPQPRGAVIRVTQGGRILAERRVPWEALDGSIRAKWFAEGVGAPADPSVEWIQ